MFFEIGKKRLKGFLINFLRMKCERLSGSRHFVSVCFSVSHSVFVDGILPCDFHKQIMYELQSANINLLGAAELLLYFN